MITILVFFIVLSILVLIHEFGHFFVAKKSGMLVEEFGFGLPPRLFGVKIGETLYSLNWLPFGGFVKIFGESPEDLKNNANKKLANRSFASKPWYKRALVIIAGPTMNFLLAVLVIAFMFTKGTPVPSGEVKVVKVEKNSPAATAGLKKGDILLKLGNVKLTESSQLMELSQKYAGKQILVSIKRKGDSLKGVTLTPRKNPPKGQGALGILISDLQIKKYSWLEAPFVGLKESLRISGMFYREMGKMLFKLITFQNPKVEVTGPIGIARLTGQAVGYGFEAVIQLLGLLSLNLALINIIPFPALDGGQLAFVLYEAVFRRPINEQIKAKINGAGFMFLLLMIALVSLKDILALF